jgi:DNA-binding LytR/AlgR family response regulator
MKVIIFEDEHHNAERLIRLLGKCDPSIEVATVVESVADGRKWFAGPHDIDLMLMDIQLSDGNCFELFNGRNVSTPVIFTTAYDNFALQAFKVNSVDYLVKPIELTALENALKKFRQFRPQSQQVDINRLAEAFFKRDTTRFISRINNQLIYIKAKDIAYIHSARGFTQATTFNKQDYPLDYSLDQVENLLDRNSFFRVNRQFIIHIDAIRKMTAYYNSRLLVQLNPPTPDDVVISRERVADFKNWLEGKV